MWRPAEISRRWASQLVALAARAPFDGAAVVDDWARAPRLLAVLLDGAHALRAAFAYLLLPKAVRLDRPLSVRMQRRVVEFATRHCSGTFVECGRESASSELVVHG